jgi:gliding motility-associated-like protein
MCIYLLIQRLKTALSKKKIMIKKLTLIAIAFFGLLVTNSFGQAGSTCATAISVTLPFNLTGQSTCGSVNNYTTICGNSTYAGGEDLVYTFTATTSGVTTISVAGGSYVGLFIVSGCPSGVSTCVGQSTGFSSPHTTVINVVAGQQYYIIIDSWPTPACNTGLTVSGTAVGPPPPPNAQDCLGAIPVCNSTYSTTASYSGTGAYLNEISSGISCLGSGEMNDVWYQFTVQTSGQLCFTIDPNVNTNDYDWAVFNLTGANCADIATNPALQVACDYSGQTTFYSGTTGTTVGAASVQGNTGLYSGTLNPNNNQVNPCIAVTAGQDMVLNVSNFSSSANGYTLTFPPSGTAGMASIYDNIPPAIQNLTVTPVCGSSSMTFNFTENILCSTASIADFAITGPGGPYTITGFTGAACAAGASSENTFTVTFSPAIMTSGSFQLCLGTAAGSVTDLCGNVAPAGCLPFTVVGTTVTATSTNVLCNGGTTGTATATGASSTGPYTYVWNPGAIAGQTASGLAAGTYTVTCTSATGCAATTTVTITQPPLLTATAAITNASCGANNGAATITAGGGTPGYTYLWTPVGGTGATATGLAPGSYTVTVKDTKNCTVTVTVVIITTGVVTSTFTQSPNQCLSGNTFNFTNTGTSVAGTTYSWSFTGPPTPPASSTSNNLTGVSFTAPGTYTVTHVVTLGSCTSTTTSTVIIYSSPTAVFTSTTNATCGNSNGTVTIGAVTGGTAPYLFNFNSGGFSATTNYTGLAAGTYPIIVQDANGCTFTSSVIINNSPGPTALAVANTSSTCGNSNGTVTIGAVTGGTPAYTYNFNSLGFAGTTNFTGLAAGTYSVIVKDANGCTFTTSVIVTNTPGPTALAVASTPTACGGLTGTVTIGAVTGGVAAYTYNFNSLGFSPTTSFTGLASGSYTVIVKDANGCTFTTSVIVGNLTAPTALVLSSTLSACATPTGTITIGATTGGTAPYTYSVNGGAYSATASYSGLAAGTYTVSVKDASGCIFTTTIVVGTVAPPTAVVLTPVNTSCGGTTGSVLIGAVTGGTAPYTYNFNSLGFSATTNYTSLAAGTYTVIVKDNNGCTFSTTVVVGNNPGPTAFATTVTPANCGLPNGAISIGTVTGGTATYTYSIGGAFSGTVNYTALLPGAYTVTVKDANGCTFSVVVTIANNSGLTASITAQINVLCNGGSTGSVTVTGTGSSAPYSYSINGTTFLTSGTFAGLASGSYTITVKDAFGCTVTVPVTITQPTLLTSSIVSQTNVLCNGGTTGSVTVAGAGGTVAYTYSLNGGAFGVSGTFTGLVAGTYTVTVKDANGCTAVQTVIITQPIIINLVTSSTNATCTAANGTATVVATGGVGPYIYSWSPAGGSGATTTGVASGVFTVTVTDANGCIKTTTVTVGNSAGGTAAIGSFTNVSCNGAANGAITVSMGGAATSPFTYVWTPSGGSAATATGLAPGTYTVTVTDVNGCTSSVSQAITQPAILTVNATFTNVGCSGGADGTATATTAGGTSPYTYLWSPGGFSTASISGLSIGAYTVVVTDAHGCTNTATANISQPPILAITSVTVPANCGLPNGSATVTGSGGFAPYTWTWSGGQTTSSVTGLAAGTYTVTIHDLNLCTQSVPVTIANNAGPVATISSFVNVGCNGGNTGSATISTTGGALPFVYLWSNGQTTPTATNLIAGIYSVTATDANGCAATSNVTITQPTALVVNTSSVSPICFGNTNGTALVSASGGTSPYSYLWTSPGAPTTAAISGLGAGTFNVTVTDAQGCIQSASVTLTNPAAVTTVVSNTSVLCNGACTGTATATVSSGFTPYSYVWTNPTAQTTVTATGLCAGTFTVNVVDAHGCPSQGTTTVTQPTLLTSMVSSTANVSCFGLCNGFAQVTAGGGTPPYVYNWMPGSVSGSLATGLCAGTYTCTVTDANGCTVQSVQVISQPALLTATASGTNITCFNACNGTATVNYAGGTAPYGFLWTPGLQTVFNPSGLCAGTQFVTVTDAEGCTATASVILTEPSQIIVVTNPVNSNCGQANGSACALVAGGVGPYTYLWNNPMASTTACANSIAAGTYNVTVTDASGCSATMNANINDILAPTLTITSSTNITCNGYANGTATSTTTGGVPAYTLLWTPGGQVVPNPTNLGPGINTLTVTDAAGCVTSASATITEPTGIVSAVTTIQNASCFGVCDGSASVVAAGGTAPLSWVWSDPSAQTTSTAINLCAGSYPVTITDANGCVKLDSATIVTEPSTLAITSSTVTDITCNGDNDGSISTVVIGGTPFYTYNWQPAVSTAPVATGLAVGTYTLVISDVNGCTTSQIWNITEPAALSYLSSFNAATCSSNNGTAEVVYSGGTTPYAYQWNDPALQTTSLAQNLFGGNYTCVITDAHGCSESVSFLVPDLSGPLVDSITSTPVLCFGGATGSATVYPRPGSGTPPLNFVWTPSGQTATTANGLTAGTYNVLITDANGCTASSVITVTQPPILSLIVSAADTICFGDTAQVYGQALGGNPAYTYNWLGASGAGLTGSGPHLVMPTTNTMYTISVVDSKGCTAGPTDMFVFVKPPLVVVASDTAICAGASASIYAIPSGGTGGPYTYSWNNSISTQTQLVTPPAGSTTTNYIVTVSDGCSIPASDTSTVTINPGSIGLLQGLPTEGCQPLTVAFTAASNNGISYSWDFGDGSTGTGSSASNTYGNPGSYDVTLTITTAAGCTTVIDSLSYVTVNPRPDASFSASPNPVSSLSPFVSFVDLSTVTITNWSWDFGDLLSTSDVSSLQNPTYQYPGTGVNTVTLIVTNQFGCLDTATQIIEIIDDYVFYAPNAFTPDGDGLNDVFIPKAIGYDIETYNLMVFDRWGNMIFSTDDYRQGWDGRANHGAEVAQEDVYVWKVQLTDNKKLKHKYIGHVTIVK